MIAAVALNMKHKKQKKIVMTCVILFFSVGEVGVLFCWLEVKGILFFLKERIQIQKGGMISACQIK